MNFHRIASILGSLLLFLSVFFLITRLTTDRAKHLKIVENFSEIENLFNKENDTTYLINFWATTCPPCLKEIPMFERITKKYRNDKVKIILVNIDMKKRVDKYVKPYLNKYNIESEVIALVDENFNVWTGKVNPDWYGALPYTVVYKNKKRDFYFGAFKSQEEVEQAMEKVNDDNSKP